MIQDWLKNSFDTISSDEWRKSGKETVSCQRNWNPGVKGRRNSQARLTEDMITVGGFNPV